MSLDLAACSRIASEGTPTASVGRLEQFEPRGEKPMLLLESVLKALPSDVSRGDGSISPHAYWFGLILAARREWGEMAKPLLRAWSSTSVRFEEEGFERAWSETLDHPHPATMKSVYRLAEANGWMRPAIASRYQLLGRAQILAQKPIEWRVKGIFPQEGIGAIYGPSGSGKSFLALDMALQMAAGSQWFGRRTTSCPVTYVMLEGEAGLRNRIAAWETSNAMETPVGFAGVPQSFAFANDDDVADLAAAVPKGGVVIIDTLNRAAPGKDENSSKDMGDILAGMKRLQRLTDGLVLVVHHTGKDVGKGMRGHSSLHAALDGAIEVRREVTGHSWRTAKVKDGADDENVPFKLHQVYLGVDGDGDGDDMTSCVIKPDVERIFKPKEPSGKRQIAALRAMQTCDGPVSWDEAVQLVGKSLNVSSNRQTNEAKAQINSLLLSGHLVSHGETLAIA